MPLARTRSVLLLPAAAAVLLAGCGSNDDPTQRSASKPAASKPAPVSGSAATALERGLPSVVAVIVGAGDGALTGTGTVVGADTVLTDATLVSDGTGGTKAAITIREADGEEHSGIVDGVDALTGLAALRVRGIEGIAPATAGALPTLGASVTALGYISARRAAVRPGAIVEFGRSVRGNGIAEAGLFASSATLGVQGVGGPIVDDSGRVVGIVTRALTSLIPGASTALPFPAATRIAKALRSGGRVRRAFLGVETVAVTPPRAKELRLTTSSGLLLSGTMPGSPASFASFRKPTGTEEIGGREIPTGGDVIVQLNDTKLAQPEDLDAALSVLKPGAKVKVKVVRDQDSAVVNVTLGER